MPRRLARGLLALAAAVAATGALAAPAAPSPDATQYRALRWRFLGPTRGGRSTVITGVPSRPNVFFMGTAGGLWKTENAGMSWANVSDSSFDSSSIGAVAVADSNPDVVWAGTGQGILRGNVAAGVGVYRSADGGRTWTHAGLRDAGQIARIRVDPRDADRVYVAVVGRAFGPSAERGVYRTTDGGRTWERVLGISAKTGATDLAIDATNPRVLYAAMWTGERKPWTIVSGSAESGLYKSEDGGDRWVELAGGLPTGVVGKIGVAVSPADPNRVWALVEAAGDEGGLYRSDDAGTTWTRLQPNVRRRLIQRTWYYQHIVADPADRNRAWVMNVDSFTTDDGGDKWEQVKGLPHGDAHDVWVNPRDPRIVAMANDGGGTISLDGGRTWSTQLNQPTAEIYNVTVDEQFPYRVYGASQDNTTFSIPSRLPAGLTPYESWRDVGGCESGNVAVDPRNPSIVYAGCGYGGEITRMDVETGLRRNVMAYAEMEVGLAPRDLKYRFNWTAPIRISPHDPGVLYHCSQFVHRSTDEGQTWTVISPDLSRNQKDKQDYSGSPVTYENTGVETNSNILAFEESPAAKGVLWAGTDDGLVHVSRDGGASWKNVTPPGLAEWAEIRTIELSAHGGDRVFVAADRHRMDDWRPYAYASDDGGATWRLLTDGRNGIPPDAPVRAVREDPVRRGLLYAATERGVFVSFDDGASWRSLQQNLPRLPVTDLRVHRGDLVVSTQGRGFWILDDATPLREISAGRGRAPRLFAPREAVRAAMAVLKPSDAFPAENPPYGATLYYSLPPGFDGEAVLEIAARDGSRVARFTSTRNAPPDPPEVFTMTAVPAGDRKLSKDAGMNRFVWDLRERRVDVVPDAIVWGFTGGPAAPPGEYTATLTAGSWKETQPLRVAADPRLPWTTEDYAAQHGLASECRDALDALYAAVRSLRSARTQAADAVKRVRDAGSLAERAESLAARTSELEEELMQPKNQADQDVENFPTKIDNQLAYVYGLVSEWDAKPTQGQVDRVRDLKARLDGVLARVRETLGAEVTAFNEEAKRLGVEAIAVSKP